jgi:hypothetical protein
VVFRAQGVMPASVQTLAASGPTGSVVSSGWGGGRSHLWRDEEADLVRTCKVGIKIQKATWTKADLKLTKFVPVRALLRRMSPFMPLSDVPHTGRCSSERELLILVYVGQEGTKNDHQRPARRQPI